MEYSLLPAAHSSEMPSSTIGDIFSTLVTPDLIKQLLTLTGLILLQVILAVALAIREKKFDWKQLANFYRTMVAPFVVGWLAFVFVVKLISVDMLGPQYSGLVDDGVTWLSWLAVVSSLGARIYKTAKDLYGSLLPLKDIPSSYGQE